MEPGLEREGRVAPYAAIVGAMKHFIIAIHLKENSL